MNLQDDDPALVARMLAFLYTGEYCVESLTTTPFGLPLSLFGDVHDPFVVADMSGLQKCLLHCQIFALADRYAISSLRTEAHSQFTRDYYGDSEEDDGGKSETGDYFYDDDELVQVSSLIRAVYESTPATVRELRRVLIRNIFVSSRRHLFDNAAMRAVLTEVPDASDLVLAHHSGPINRQTTCEACDEKEKDYNVQELCACGNVGPCDVLACQQQWKKESVCERCYVVGKMSYPVPQKSKKRRRTEEDA